MYMSLVGNGFVRHSRTLGSHLTGAEVETNEVNFKRHEDDLNPVIFRSAQIGSSSIPSTSFSYALELPGYLTTATLPTAGQVLQIASVTQPEATSDNRDILLEFANSSGGGSSTLASLTDTTISSASAGQSLLYSGSAWVNADLNLPQLADVTVAGDLAAGHTIKYNGSGWITTPLPYSSFASVMKLNNSGHTTAISNSNTNHAENHIRWLGTSTTAGTLVTLAEETLTAYTWSTFTVSLTGNYLIVCNIDIGINFTTTQLEENEQVTLACYKNDSTLLNSTMTDVSARTSATDLDADTMHLNMIVPLNSGDKLHFNIKSENDANSFMANDRANVHVAFISV